jgi:mannosyltransferase
MWCRAGARHPPRMMRPLSTPASSTPARTAHVRAARGRLRAALANPQGEGLAAAVALLTLLALALRLPSFDDGLFGDELASYFIVTGHGIGRLVDIVQGPLEATPPLYYLLAKLTPTFGHPAEALRAVSLLSGVAAIPLTYLIGRRTVGARAGLLASLLVALNPFLIFYATEARAYSLSLLFDLAATLALLKAIDERRGRWWAGFAVCACAAVYSHYTAVFVLVVLFAWALVTAPRDRWALLAAGALAVVGFAPWLPDYLDDRHGGFLVIGLLDPFGWHALWHDLGNWAIVGVPVGLPRRLPIVLALAGLAVGLAGTAAEAIRRRRRRPSSRVVLVVLLALAAPGLAALFSVTGPTVFTTRNLITSTPFLALAVAAVLLRAGKPLGGVAAAAILAALAIGAVRMTKSSYQRPDYPAVVAFIERSGAAGDPVVDAPFAPIPVSSLEAALGYGTSSAAAHPVLRLGSPPLRAAVAATLSRQNPLQGLAVPSPAAIAQRATALAKRGTLFLVTFGAPGAAGRSTPPGLAGQFVRGLPAAFRVDQTRTFPGAGSIPLQVYVLRRPPG